MTLRRYKVWEPVQGDTFDDAHEVEACDAEDAATGWADWSDAESADYAIVGGAPADVAVLDVESGERTDWTVTGESVPYYTAWPRRSEA